ncbi:thiol reductant ABC exporter subunit CydD [Oceanithermus sp.]
MRLDRRLLGAARRTPALLGLSLGLRLAAGAAIVAEAAIVARLVNAAFLQGANRADLGGLFVALALAIVLRAVFSGWASERAGALAAAVKEDLRRRLTEHALALGPARMGGVGSAGLATVLAEGVEGVEPFFKGYLPALAQAAFLPLLILLVVFPLDWPSGLVLLVTAPLIPMFMILIGRWAGNLAQKQWRALHLLGAYYLDALRGLATLKLFGAEARALERIERLVRVHRDATLRVLRVAFLSALVLELMATLATAIVAVEVGMRLLAGRMEFLPAFTVLLLAPEFYQPLRNLGSQFHAAEDAAAAAEAVYGLLKTPAPDSPERSKPAPTAPVELVLEGVRFGYGERPVFDGVDLTVPAGQFLALVGPSGAGKSTLVQLLLGFLTPQAGRVRAGEAGLDEMAPEDWRRQVAWVPQRPFLQEGTVRENLLLARPDASQEELERAARDAGALDFIEALPHGWETWLGEDGGGLSGGQLQRLALARAFLKDAPFVFLDEPTAHLDGESERRIHEALARLAAGRTLIVVAHRLDAAALADRVVVLDGGRVVCDGKHDELLAGCALYRKLWCTYREAAA